MGRLLAVCLLFALSSAAEAQYSPGSGSWTGSGVTQSQFRPNPGLLPGGGWQFSQGTTFGNPPPPRSWVNGVWGARVVDSYALTRGGAAFTATAATTALWPAVGAAVARCVALVNPYCAVATAAYTIYRNRRVFPDGDGGLLRDPGIDPETGTVIGYCATGSSNCSGIPTSALASTPQGTCSGSIAGHPDIYEPPDALAPYGWCSYWQTDSGGYYRRFDVGARAYSGQSCPASTDPFNPAYSVPAGSPVGYDGKCPSARYNWQPISTGDAGAQFPFGTNYTGSDVQGAIDGALQSGESIPATMQTNGPASVTGTPTTTTTSGPNGTSTATSTPTYTFNYGPTTITYGPTTTSTTTITNNGGTSTTTTTETTTPPTEATEQTTDCDKFPQIIGCSQYGTMDPPPSLDRNQDVSFSPDSGWGPSDAACPADVQLPNHWNAPIAFGWGPTCTFVSGLRYVILALAWVCAAYIFLGIAKVE